MSQAWWRLEAGWVKESREVSTFAVRLWGGWGEGGRGKGKGGRGKGEEGDGGGSEYKNFDFYFIQRVISQRVISQNSESFLKTLSHFSKSHYSKSHYSPKYSPAPTRTLGVNLLYAIGTPSTYFSSLIASGCSFPSAHGHSTSLQRPCFSP